MRRCENFVCILMRQFIQDRFGWRNKCGFQIVGLCTRRRWNSLTWQLQRLDWLEEMIFDEWNNKRKERKNKTFFILAFLSVVFNDAKPVLFCSFLAVTMHIQLIYSMRSLHHLVMCVTRRITLLNYQRLLILAILSCCCTHSMRSHRMTKSQLLTNSFHFLVRLVQFDSRSSKKSKFWRKDKNYHENGRNMSETQEIEQQTMRIKRVSFITQIIIYVHNVVVTVNFFCFVASRQSAPLHAFPHPLMWASDRDE